MLKKRAQEEVSQVHVYRSESEPQVQTPGLPRRTQIHAAPDTVIGKASSTSFACAHDKPWQKETRGGHIQLSSCCLIQTNVPSALTTSNKTSTHDTEITSSCASLLSKPEGFRDQAISVADCGLKISETGGSLPRALSS